MIEYREYQIKAHKEWPSLLVIVTAGKGGKIPNVLDGLFTSVAVAKERIDSYLENRIKKE